MVYSILSVCHVIGYVKAVSCAGEMYSFCLHWGGNRWYMRDFVGYRQIILVYSDQLYRQNATHKTSCTADARPVVRTPDSQSFIVPRPLGLLSSETD